MCRDLEGNTWIFCSKNGSWTSTSLWQDRTPDVMQAVRRHDCFSYFTHLHMILYIQVPLQPTVTSLKDSGTTGNRRTHGHLELLHISSLPVAIIAKLGSILFMKHTQPCNCCCHHPHAFTNLPIWVNQSCLKSASAPGVWCSLLEVSFTRIVTTA